MNFFSCTCIALLLCCPLCYGMAAASDPKSFKIMDKIETCSRNLTYLLDNLCDKEYKVVKPDMTSFLDKLMPNDLLQHHKSKRRALATERWRRVRRQIASECCDQPCTIGNLILYCPPDAKLVLEDPDIFDAIP